MIVYIINDKNILNILFVFILSMIYFFTNNIVIPPTPYTKVIGPFSMPLGFNIVFLKIVLSIINPNNEYKKKEFI